MIVCNRDIIAKNITTWEGGKERIPVTALALPPFLPPHGAATAPPPLKKDFRAKGLIMSSGRGEFLTEFLL